MNAALILSGGTGTRLGTQIPKRYIEVNGKPVIAHGLERQFVTKSARFNLFLQAHNLTVMEME